MHLEDPAALDATCGPVAEALPVVLVDDPQTPAAGPSIDC
jgi:hypothetical protein